MTDEVVVLVPTTPGDDPWTKGAAAAATALAARGVRVDLRVGMPDTLPVAEVVISHGIQYDPLVRTAAPGARVIMSDRPATPLPAGATGVDWCWPDAAEEAGRVAAGVGGAGSIVGIVAGPAVPTQRRVVAGFVEGVGARAQVAALHLRAFDAVTDGAKAGGLLAGEFGCVVVAHAADEAGLAATTAAAALGARTIGFLEPAPGDLGWIRSDIGGCLSALALRSLGGETLPSLFRADAVSGYGSFELRSS